MPKRTSVLTDDQAKLHKNHSYEWLVATWLMNDGWQVFWPLLDAAHGVDLIASDGPKSYRLQVKSLESQDLGQQVKTHWKGRHVDFVIYFAKKSNWGYVCPAFAANQKKLDHESHKRFECTLNSFLKAFNTCEHPEQKRESYEDRGMHISR